MSSPDRRAERRLLLVDAAFDLLGTVGWSGTTVRAIVERASLHPRYFYESFDELDGLVVAVYDRLVDELGMIVLGALADSGDDPAVQVRAVVKGIVEFVDEDRRRGRVLYAEGLGNEALNLRRMDAGRAVVAFVERYVEERRGLAGAGETIDRLGAAFLVGGFSQLLIDWLDGRVRARRDELINDATELFLAVGDAASSIASSRRDHGAGKTKRPRRKL